MLAAAYLHQLDGVGSRLSSLAEYALRYSHAPSSLCHGLCCLCRRFVLDDVSKVTLPAWPGQGMDAIGYLQN